MRELEHWVEEHDHEDFRIRLRATEILYEDRTEFQHLVLFRNPSLGRVLVLDGIVQTTEKDEFVYHEMMAHVPLLAHGRARRVLIVGGGDGGLLEEVLKHPTVEAVTMIEIDRKVVEFAKEHLRSICREAFEDPRVTLAIADGFDFVAGTAERYDAILIDSSDPIGPGEKLFTEPFYRACREALAEGGVMVHQSSIPFFHPHVVKRTHAAMSPVFADMAHYLVTVPTYTGGELAIAWGSDDPALRQVTSEVLEERFNAAGLETRYYTPAVHKAAFALPAYVRQLVQ